MMQALSFLCPPYVTSMAHVLIRIFMILKQQSSYYITLQIYFTNILKIKLYLEGYLDVAHFQKRKDFHNYKMAILN